VALALQHKVNLNKPKERYICGQFMQSIVCNAMRKYDLYSGRAEKTDMARAIIREHPHLHDHSKNGYSGWSSIDSRLPQEFTPTIKVSPRGGSPSSQDKKGQMFSSFF